MPTISGKEAILPTTPPSPPRRLSPPLFFFLINTRRKNLIFYNFFSKPFFFFPLPQKKKKKPRKKIPKLIFFAPPLPLVRRGTHYPLRLNTTPAMVIFTFSRAGGFIPPNQSIPFLYFFFFLSFFFSIITSFFGFCSVTDGILSFNSYRYGKNLNHFLPSHMGGFKRCTTGKIYNLAPDVSGYFNIIEYDLNSGTDVES
ncbi:MAG: hypothetical protein IPP29_17755 [Bacteroidetes bacterium]|nr:hypothetical protein [Bacteroidota bacterium]